MSVGFEKRSIRLVIWALTAIALIVVYLPPIYLVGVSFNPALQPALPAPGEISLKWYGALLGEGRLFAALRESLLIASVVTLVSTVTALIAALAYLELGKLRNSWFLLMILPMFVPGIIQGLALSVLLNRWEVVPFWGTVALGHVLWAMPFSFTVILTSMVSVRRSYLLAAADLGAGWGQRTRQIVLPLILPGLVGSVVFSFLLSFNEFSRSSYLVGRQNTLPLEMFGKMNSGATPTIYALSGLTLIVSILLVGIVMLISARRSRS
ncbi:ABC transporter permease [Xinfangfangia sp. D13-10-4-6]|uniref:ABC transporter permease n=1 Tax=Pseudogemmobacter hezensis TaxID=2737662 RepID=UPI0015562FEC|nr:ABC transporter permease [Pseudogemmobacter hezensis]NPD16751.1 ABC transporter permease [Pseudogemmobacter hezensis]